MARCAHQQRAVAQVTNTPPGRAGGSKIEMKLAHEPKTAAAFSVMIKSAKSLKITIKLHAQVHKAT